MQIHTLKVYEYNGQRVYIRNIGNVFEYLAFVGKDLYTSHLVVSKGFFQRLFGRPYTEKQLLDITKYMTQLAEASVDYALAPKDVKEAPK